MEGRKHLINVIHPVLDSLVEIDETFEQELDIAIDPNPSEVEEDGLLSSLKAMQAETSSQLMAAAAGSSNDTTSSAPTCEPNVNMLLTWPLHDLNEQDKKLSIFKFISGDDSDISGPLSLSYFYDMDGIQPTDFRYLRDDVVLSIGVAMLWGWVPAKMTCNCGGPMELRRAAMGSTFQDCLTWYCLNKGNIKQRVG